MTVDTSIAGRRFGNLLTEYGDLTGRRIGCRCCCERLIFVAVEDLVAGTVTSCGCRPPSNAYHRHYSEIRAQRLREFNFNVARARA
jgi:hypothetical protein